MREKKKSDSGFQETESLGQKEFDIFKNEESHSAPGFKRPLRSETKIYFAQNQWPDKEADKFYNHYESNGWMIGKTPMANWNAAANNWILNSENFINDKIKNKPGNLHTSTGKDYSEPL